MNLKKWWDLALCFATLGRAGCAGERPQALGVADGELAPCPSSPNCVSTQTASERHTMEPIVYMGSRQRAQNQLLSILHAMERVQVIESQPGYVHAEARSRTFGFVDDIEFLFDKTRQRIHFRSAARLGHGDGGVNRRRMEKITQAFADVAVAQAVQP